MILLSKLVCASQVPKYVPMLTFVFPKNLSKTTAINTKSKSFLRREYTVLASVSKCCSVLMGRFPRVTHPFATNLSEQAPISPFDLHVLSIPPAFVLSQDQTLKFDSVLFLLFKILTGLISLT